MKKALSPVRGRLRARHGLTGLCWGAAAAGLLLLAVLAVSFFTPLAGRGGLLALGTLALPLGGLVGALWPVSDRQAARAADACGLRERAQTALALAGRQDEMARLQRADALRALQGLDTRSALPLRPARLPLLAGAGCLALCAALLLIPNPQEEILAARQQFAQRMEAPSQALAQAAEQVADQLLGERDAREVRRLLAELSRQTARSRDAREALTALGNTQQQLERLLSQAREAAGEALSQAGMEAAAEALGRQDMEGLQ